MSARPANGGGAISLEQMRQHLDTVFIGYRPGDPTVGPPPNSLPPPPSHLKIIDLRQMTMAELAAEAAATQPRDPFEVLLPNPPGVPPDRIAYVTGQDPTSRGQQGAPPSAAAGRQAAASHHTESAVAAAAAAAPPPREGSVKVTKVKVEKGAAQQQQHGKQGAAAAADADDEMEDAGPAAEGSP